MKFVCDRCKTRYSIGDERVRGKILKIRCKNCANVITVREGMAVDSDGVSVATELPGRKPKTTTTAPEALSDVPSDAGANEPNAGEPARAARSSPRQGAGALPTSREYVGNLLGKDAPPAKEPAAKAPVAMTARLPAGASLLAAAAPAKRTVRDEPARAAAAAQRAKADKLEASGALGAAYASSIAKPPPALEEEWYVSIDGEQSGPFSLGEAQRWVAQKPLDADLHCWSEGFDDWLPVDKVSHFRGLRKKPAPPPLPRLGSVGPRASTSNAAAPAASEPEPKPLFSATMASLERSTPAPGAGKPPATSARATPPLGTPVDARPEARSDARTDARSTTRDTPGKLNGSPASRAEIKTIAAGPATTRMAPFDTSDGEAATELSAPQFHASPVDPASPARPAEPSALEANAARNDAVISAAASDFESGAHGDELDIGEVSRVVNLADIMRGPRGTERPVPNRSASFGRVTGANGNSRVTGAIGRLSSPSIAARGGTATHRSVNPPLSISPTPTGEAPPEQDHAPATRAHHRGLIALFTVATIMVVGGVAAVVLFVTGGDDTTDGTLGTVRNIDTSRPEDPITHRPIEPGPTAPNQQQRPTQPRIATQPRPPLSGQPGAPNPPHDETPAPGEALRSDEIEEAARKHQEMTQRCYQRSQRGADSIIVGDVKKITVTLTVDKEGNVADLSLSDHAADNLGKCLTTSIRGWKFRPSTGGTFRLSLAFAGG